jgi:hypothetical protein
MDAEMSARTPQQKFWNNPSVDAEGVGNLSHEYVECCLPEYYIDLNENSHLLCEIINAYTRPTSVLELGCGCGRNLMHLIRRGFLVSGIEINNASKELAHRHFPRVADSITVGSVELQLPRFPKMPVILTSGFLMHLPPESEHVFEMMAEKTLKLLVINEVEGDPKSTDHHYPKLRFMRKYREIFESLGLDQVAQMKNVRLPRMSMNVIRVFKRVG